MYLKIGCGREKRHRKESYVVFNTPKKYSHFAPSPVEKKLKMANFSSYFYQVLLTSSF